MDYNRRILIVDDQDELRKEIKNILGGINKRKELLSDIEGIISDFAQDSMEKEEASSKKEKA